MKAGSGPPVPRGQAGNWAMTGGIATKGPMNTEEWWCIPDKDEADALAVFGAESVRSPSLSGLRPPEYHLRYPSALPGGRQYRDKVVLLVEYTTLVRESRTA